MDSDSCGLEVDEAHGFLVGTCGANVRLKPVPVGNEGSPLAATLSPAVECPIVPISVTGDSDDLVWDGARRIVAAALGRDALQRPDSTTTPHVFYVVAPSPTPRCLFFSIFPPSNSARIMGERLQRAYLAAAHLMYFTEKPTAGNPKWISEILGPAAATPDSLLARLSTSSPPMVHAVYKDPIRTLEHARNHAAVGHQSLESTLKELGLQKVKVWMGGAILGLSNLWDGSYSQPLFRKVSVTVWPLVDGTGDLTTRLAEQVWEIIEGDETSPSLPAETYLERLQMVLSASATSVILAPDQHLRSLAADLHFLPTKLVTSDYGKPLLAKLKQSGPWDTKAFLLHHAEALRSVRKKLEDTLKSGAYGTVPLETEKKIRRAFDVAVLEEFAALRERNKLEAHRENTVLAERLWMELVEEPLRAIVASDMSNLVDRIQVFEQRYKLESCDADSLAVLIEFIKRKESWIVSQGKTWQLATEQRELYESIHRELHTTQMQELVDGVAEIGDMGLRLGAELTAKFQEEIQRIQSLTDAARQSLQDDLATAMESSNEIHGAIVQESTDQVRRLYADAGENAALLGRQIDSVDSQLGDMDAQLQQAKADLARKSSWRKGLQIFLGILGGICGLVLTVSTAGLGAMVGSALINAGMSTATAAIKSDNGLSWGQFGKIALVSAAAGFVGPAVGQGLGMAANAVLGQTAASGIGKLAVNAGVLCARSSITSGLETMLGNVMDDRPLMDGVWDAMSRTFISDILDGLSSMGSKRQPDDNDCNENPKARKRART